MQKSFGQHDESRSRIRQGRACLNPLAHLNKVGRLELLGVGIHVGLHHQRAKASGRGLGV